MTKGRTVPAPLTHTFPNGVVATLHPISQFTIANLQVAASTQIPKPQPPRAPVPGVGEGVTQDNVDDPEYQAAVAAWQGQVTIRLNDLIMEVAVDVDIDAAALERITTTMARVGAPLEELSDKIAYIKHVCLAGISEAPALEAEIIGMLGPITGKAVPTEADVHAHIATFPADVGGGGHLHDPGPAE